MIYLYVVNEGERPQEFYITYSAASRPFSLASVSFSVSLAVILLILS